MLPVTAFRRLQKGLPDADFEDVGPAIVRQRAVKSPWEVERIRAAAAVADEVSRLIPGLLREGLTEVEFAGSVEAQARRLGHEGFIRMRGFNQEMFYGQLLTGVSGTAPTYLDTPLGGTGLSPSIAQGVSFRTIGRGEPVVFDFVPVRDGYIADFTRIFTIGPLPGALVTRLRGRPSRAAGRGGRGPARRHLPRPVRAGPRGGRGRGTGRALHGPRPRPGALHRPRRRARARRAARAHGQRPRARGGHGVRPRAQVRAARPRRRRRREHVAGGASRASPRSPVRRSTSST